MVKTPIMTPHFEDLHQFIIAIVGGLHAQREFPMTVGLAHYHILTMAHIRPRKNNEPYRNVNT